MNLSLQKCDLIVTREHQKLTTKLWYCKKNTDHNKDQRHAGHVNKSIIVSHYLIDLYKSNNQIDTQ